MASRTRQWTVGVCTAIIVLSLGLFAARHWKGAVRVEKAAPPAGQAEREQVVGSADIPPLLQKQAKHVHKDTGKHVREVGGANRPEGAGPPLPPRTMVLMEDGRLVPMKGTKLKLGAPGVLAEVYEGAPPVAVRRLWNVLRSGSNEYAEFTKTEKYPEWVYDAIEEMYPGRLGKLLAHLARRQSAWEPEHRPRPVLDYGDGEHDPYTEIYIGEGADIPVAQTKYGTVGADLCSGDPAPVNYAAFLAHRLASGDSNVHTPRIPPGGYRDWEHWVRDNTTDERQAELERLGILPKKAG